MLGEGGGSLVFGKSICGLLQSKKFKYPCPKALLDYWST